VKKFLLLLLIWSTPSAFAELTVAARDRLWKDVESQIRSTRMVYDHGKKGIPYYPGWVVPNETTHGTIAPAEGPADLQVGVGTTINFNIAASRKTDRLVMVDQSPEVVAMNQCFYRTLFLTAETPAEFLAFTSGLEPIAGETVPEIEIRMRQVSGSAAGLKALGKRVAKLVKKGILTEVDAQFALAVASDQVFRRDPAKGQVPVFRNAAYGDQVREALFTLYSFGAQQEAMAFSLMNARLVRETLPESQKHLVPEQEALKATAKAYLERFKDVSFLTPEGYAHVRGLFQEKADSYALSTIENPKLWKAVASLATKEQRKLTDFYVSNIPTANTFRPGRFRDQLYLGISEVPRDKVVWYEAPLNADQPFLTEEIDLKTEPRRFLFFRWNDVSICHRVLGQDLSAQ